MLELAISLHTMSRRNKGNVYVYLKNFYLIVMLGPRKILEHMSLPVGNCGSTDKKLFKDF